MKRIKRKPGSLFWGLLIFLAIATSSQAQSYEITWWVVGGGGGTSIGGDYTLSGTVGQSDTGRVSGGSYSIDGGFWGPLASYYLYLPLVLN
jgi:hypothetical protein